MSFNSNIFDYEFIRKRLDAVKIKKITNRIQKILEYVRQKMDFA